MNFDISAYITNEMKARGYTDYKVESVYYDVGSEFFRGPGLPMRPTPFMGESSWSVNNNFCIRKFIDLQSDIFLFVNQDVDTDITTKIELIGQDNYFVFSKSLLQSSFMAHYQFFTGEIEIKMTHFNSEDFVYPRLEFLRITPIFD